MSVLWVGVVAAVMVAALLLRLLWLGNTFQSSDNAEVADGILRHAGWRWMIRENYGVLVNAWTKLFIGTASLLGVQLNEWWWKAPIAIAGTLQLPVTLHTLTRLGVSWQTSFAAATIMAVLPIHVFQSRYPCGHEVLGLLFLFLALPALTRFFSQPSRANGLRASLFLGMYLLSHGYLLPILPGLFLIMYLYGPQQRWWSRLLEGLRDMSRHLVWLFPVLLYPLYRQSLHHAREKNTALGFYLTDHFEGFLGNIGLLFLLLLLVGTTAPLWCKRARTRPTALLTGLAVLYLAPLLFGTPPGVTVVRTYMLIGIACGLLSALCAFDQLEVRPRAYVLMAVWLAAGFTAYGLVTQLFQFKLYTGDPPGNPLRIEVERGAVPPDPLIKAGGYLYRRHIPPHTRTLSLHDSVEPPTYRYYFGGNRDDVVFYDLPSDRYAQTLARYRDSVAVIVADERAASMLLQDPLFQKRISVSLRPDGPSGFSLFVREGMSTPSLHEHYAPLNEAFDREFAPRVSLFD